MNLVHSPCFARTHHVSSLAGQFHENIKAVKAYGRAWVHILFPVSLALDYKLKKTKINHELRMIAVVFAMFLETLANIVSCMIKPAAMYLWVSIRSSQCAVSLAEGKLFYRRKQYDKALECFKKSAEINKNGLYQFFVRPDELRSRLGKTYYWLGKCHRRQDHFEIAKVCWELVRAFRLTDANLNKNIEHKLVKIELVSGEPLFKASSKDLHRLSSWEVIASRTYCENIFTSNARNMLLNEMKNIYTKPEIKAIFDVVARLVRKYPDKFNCLILSPQTMEKYYGGKGRVRGFYNMRYSICAAMDPNKGFTYRSLGTMIHELTHLAMRICYHLHCGPSCSPFRCNDQQEKKEFERIELDLLTIILKVVQSLYAGTTLDFDIIGNLRAESHIDKKTLIQSVADNFREISQKEYPGYENECHIVEHILEAYNLFSSPNGAQYDPSEIPNELIARVPQLLAEIDSDTAFNVIAPLKSYYDQKVCAFLRESLKVTT